MCKALSYKCKTELTEESYKLPEESKRIRKRGGGGRETGRERARERGEEGVREREQVSPVTLRRYRRGTKNTVFEMSLEGWARFQKSL